MSPKTMRIVLSGVRQAPVIKTQPRYVALLRDAGVQPGARRTSE